MTTTRRVRGIILIAKAVSVVFTPFFLPIMGLLALFTFSYLSLLPFSYMATTLGLVLLFTALLPAFLIRVYRHYNGWTLLQLGHRERRVVPYLISIGCYMACNYIMLQMNMPYFMCAIITMALLVQIACALINTQWKVSTHTAAVGGFAGALVAFADIFGFNPVWWLCVIVLLAGVLGTSRMILRQHSLGQVVGGFCIGFVCAIIGAII